MSFKKCFKCLAMKPLTEFYRHSMMADGHLNKCKECAKEDVRRHRSENPEKLQAYEKKRWARPERKAAVAAIGKRCYEQHPDRWLARAAVYRAVKRGEVKPQPCWVCGAKAEAHHPDYSRQLDVVWLCSPHHKQAHAIARH